jgi:hypothetical protein
LGSAKADVSRVWRSEEESTGSHSNCHSTDERKDSREDGRVVRQLTLRKRSSFVVTMTGTFVVGPGDHNNDSPPIRAGLGQAGLDRLTQHKDCFWLYD